MLISLLKNKFNYLFSFNIFLTLDKSFSGEIKTLQNVSIFDPINHKNNRLK